MVSVPGVRCVENLRRSELAPLRQRFPLRRWIRRHVAGQEGLRGVSFVRRYYEERAARADIRAAPRPARLAPPRPCAPNVPDRNATPAIKTRARNVLAGYRALLAMTPPH
jgi:hypothetical protein